MAQNQTNKTIIEEYRERIRYLSNLSKAIYQKKVKIHESNGTVDVDMNGSELMEMAGVEHRILQMKKELAEMEKNEGVDEDDL